MNNTNLKLYSELAAWWPLLSAPGDYAEEAAFYLQVFREAGAQPMQTMLELGSGGGNNASHLKHHFRMTLVDPSPGMLAVSRELNPECEHVAGDMRTVRLDRLFDAIFIHDAIDYMTTEADLRQALETAYLHCRAGGVALFAPDHVRETFAPTTDHGGHDGPGRGLRYLEWTRAATESDTSYVIDFAYLLQDGDRIWVEHDRHLCGLFERAVWLRLVAEVGFEASTLVDYYERELFVGVKPAA